MRRISKCNVLLVAACVAFGQTAVSQPVDELLVAISDTDPAPLIAEHVYGGMPMEGGTVYVRQGYVMAYDPDRRVPRWVAYRIAPDYLNTPRRDGRFTTFRVDPDVAEAPRSTEYTHSGFDRGHLAPYFAMGGDRDGDGRYAADGDEQDMITIFQGNYMGNIAPQYPQGFNQSPGLWWTIETWLRDNVVRDHGNTAWVFAGTIFGLKRYHGIGPEQDIEVAPMLYMLIVIEQEADELPLALAFLLPHQQVRRGEPEHFLVSVRLLEAMAGLTFFRELVETHGEETIAQWKAEESWERWPVLEEPP